MPDSTNIIAYQTADLAAGTISPEQITCTQYDRQAKLIAVRLKENGKDWTIPTGYRANVRMRKADGVYVYNTCTTEGNIAYITLTEQMCGVVGEQIYVLEVINGDHAVQSVTGRLKVIQNPIDDEDADFTSAPEYTTIQTAVADAQQAAQDAVDAAEAAKTSQTAAAQSASSAASSANSAAGSANSAYGYMQNASQSATNAANSAAAAKTAQTAAEAAQTAAETAQEAAEEAQKAVEADEKKIGKITIVDTSDNTTYLGSFCIVDGYPALQLEQL